MSPSWQADAGCLCAMTSTSSRTHRSFPLLQDPCRGPGVDVDDLTLGEMLTEAYRGQVDYFVQEGVSVSQLSSSVRFDRSGQPDGESSPRALVDRSGQPDECNSSKAQIRTLLEEQRQTTSFLRNVTQESVTTNSKQLKPKKSADSFKDNYGNRNWNFVKLINEVLQRWKNYGNFRVLHSILWQDENSSRIRILSWNSARVQELQNEVNCMNDSKDFQDAESIRSGNSHVTSRPVSFPPHPIPEGMLRHSFVTPSRREGPPSIWDTHGISGNVFCKSRCVIISTLSTRIASMEFIDRRAAPFVHSGEK